MVGARDNAHHIGMQELIYDLLWIVKKYIDSSIYSEYSYFIDSEYNV